ncbi:EAL domain-containing protein [Pseudocitrobacter cyperus]|uniref:cyclic-guanylate-specific phosphodiesterase n=1 Tax=Pseudocitrobacter cyperus TaxID=3112843 RepID=A0ABV0HFI0_9ENTR
MVRATLPYVAAVCFFVAGTFILNLQLWYSAKSENVAAATHATNSVNTILEEARSATRTGFTIATTGCTPEGQYQLGTEAALKPHLRTILILKEGKIWCSSLPGNRLLINNLTELPETRLTLVEGINNVHQRPSLVYRTQHPDATVLVTVSDSHIRDALDTTRKNTHLRMIVGSHSIGFSGDVETYTTKTDREAIVVSKAFPFAIGYMLPPFFSVERILRQGAGLLLFILLMSAIAFYALGKYLNKYTAPTDTLRRAILKGDIIPYYQPVMDGRDNSIRGVEVLARWKQPDAGFISPSSFIPLAEKSGLIIPLTQSLMWQVVAHMNAITTLLPEGFHVGINFSAAHINAPSFVEDCLRYQAGFVNKQLTLVLEVTEREPLHVDDQLISNLNTLHANGFAIALDDFGTGYSGLSYLHDLNIDYIKIDHSFVGRVNEDEDSTKLLDCVLELARKLSLSIVAEGVETRAQLEYLNRNNIPLLQGYYFYKPVKFVELVKILLSKPKEKIERYIAP